MTVARDLIGYGRTPPDPKWPHGARLAVQIVMNYEEGSEYSIQDGDGFSEDQLTEGASRVPHGTRDLTAESVYEFGSRVGFWRLMRLFAERDIPITVFGCALALERHPEAAAAIVEAGHDICCHGWRWVKHWLLSEAEERDHIQRAVASLEKLTGSAARSAGTAGTVPATTHAGWWSKKGASFTTATPITTSFRTG